MPLKVADLSSPTGRVVRHDHSVRRALNRGRDVDEGDQAEFLEDHGFLIEANKIARVVDPMVCIRRRTRNHSFATTIDTYRKTWDFFSSLCRRRRWRARAGKEIGVSLSPSVHGARQATDPPLPCGVPGVLGRAVGDSSRARAYLLGSSALSRPRAATTPAAAALFL